MDIIYDRVGIEDIIKFEQNISTTLHCGTENFKTPLKEAVKISLAFPGIGYYVD